MLTFAILIIFNVNSYAGTQRWNSLDYDVTVNSDGSMDVVETWDCKRSIETVGISTSRNVWQ